MVTWKCEVCGKEVTKGGSKPGRFCSLACKAEWQREQKPVDREWLYQKYVVEEMSANDIAQLVGRNSKRVWQWLRDYGIETRHRGYGHEPYFKPGMESPFKGHKHTQETRQQIRERRKADGRVPYLKNGVHHLKGKRGAETPNWKGGVTPERQETYSSAAWKEAVKVVWQRDNATCQRCGLDHRIINRETIRFAIHHIVSFANKELRYEPSNLVLLCPTCHRWVHSKANTRREFLK